MIKQTPIRVVLQYKWYLCCSVALMYRSQSVYLTIVKQSCFVWIVSYSLAISRPDLIKCTLCILISLSLFANCFMLLSSFFFILNIGIIIMAVIIITSTADISVTRFSDIKRWIFDYTTEKKNLREVLLYFHHTFALLFGHWRLLSLSGSRFIGLRQTNCDVYYLLSDGWSAIRFGTSVSKHSVKTLVSWMVQMFLSSDVVQGDKSGGGGNSWN